MIRANKTLLAFSGAALLLVTACTDPNQVGGGTDSNQKAKQGAIIGGIIGAGTGAVVSDSKGKGAVLGGVIGALGGAAIGSALDRQEAELRQQLNDDVRIVNTGDRLILTMPQDILFAVDSFAVTQTLRSDLFRVAQSLQRYPDTTVQVVGHTDSTGAASYNQQLSERRASAVANVLMEGGVPGWRIRAIGRGEDQPVASNLTPEGRALNRRVEIVILPN
ncbi:OmpA family protein [Roseovarius autotrophicus]|uniref:OmpA family protein n=1 Tax=Roseovarius autotrophicus TaxID=2824121 RepID=UPI0019DCAE3B|nr:OmpA family protein [Roseovarius autotrophicus]MBE0454330.1 OmpA family protein [Roseovarius sp.]